MLIKLFFPYISWQTKKLPYDEINSMLWFYEYLGETILIKVVKTLSHSLII